jgi:hypothetical protein
VINATLDDISLLDLAPSRIRAAIVAARDGLATPASRRADDPQAALASG